MNYKPDICFYHDPCLDGFAAAYAIWTKWPDIEFIGMAYGDEIDLEGFEDKNVLFVDFSLKNSAIWKMAETAKTVVILDHHKSAMEDLQGFTNFDGSLEELNGILNSFINVFVHFDMEHSGAVLAYRFTQLNTNLIPLTYRYIEDRDLWKFKYKETKPFNLAIYNLPKDFNYWYNNIILNENSWVTIGETILNYQNELVEQIAKNSFISDWKIGDDKYSVSFCNTPILQSEVGNYLINTHKDIDFAAVYFVQKDGTTKYSLRSEDGRADVSKIASLFGGGGHHSAAGFIKYFLKGRT